MSILAQLFPPHSFVSKDVILAGVWTFGPCKALPQPCPLTYASAVFHTPVNSGSVEVGVLESRCDKSTLLL